MRRRKGIIGSAVGLAAAAAGTLLVADRKVGATRRVGIAAQDEFAEPVAARGGFLRAEDGVALYYEQDGPLGAPVTVVFVHGFCLNRNDFLFQRRALLDAFGDRIRIISFDQRSHGRSERSSVEHATIEQLGADLGHVITYLVPDGSVVLVGHSMGGMAILALADERPGLFAQNAQVAGVVLISTTTGKLATVTLGLPAALARVGGPILPLLLRGARHEAALIERGRARVTDVAWVFVKRLAFGGPVSPGRVEFLTRMIGQTPVDVIADFYPALIDHDKLDAVGVLSETRVSVICGERDLLTPKEHSQTIADALPDAELVVVAGAGHQVLMEQPEPVNSSIVRIVERVLESARDPR